MVQKGVKMATNHLYPISEKTVLASLSLVIIYYLKVQTQKATSGGGFQLRLVVQLAIWDMLY